MSRLLRQTYPSHTKPIRKTDLDNAYQDIGQVVNGGIEFGDPTNGSQNINGQWAELVTPIAPDTEFAIPHNLGRIPAGWLTLSINNAGILYRSATPWTKTQVFLKCNTSSAGVKIFVT